MTRFQTIADECDKLFNSGDSAGVENLLLASLAEAEKHADQPLQLFIQSELMGHYRMQGDTEKSLLAVKRGMELLSALADLDSRSAGTILINAGTALSAAGKYAEALEKYQQAEQHFSRVLSPDDYLQAGLFNNMASVYAASGESISAENHYLKALDILQSQQNHADSAVTCINLAQLYARTDPDDPLISVMLASAAEHLNSPALARDGYCAHTCLKCAPAFEFFGDETFAAELRHRAKEIYERN